MLTNTVKLTKGQIIHAIDRDEDCLTLCGIYVEAGNQGMKRVTCKECIREMILLIGQGYNKYKEMLAKVNRPEIKEGDKKMTLFKSRCYNGGNQHKFLPRYDEVPNDVAHIKAHYADLDELKSLIYCQKYLFDVCEWCGKKIER